MNPSLCPVEPHDLYGLPLEQFTEQRNALARELRKGGRREEAAAVAKLRKPSVAAWAVNQLVRTQQREVDALFSAGDALRQAQSDVLARRGDAASLRRRVEAERAAVEKLTDKARGLLNGDGHELTPGRLEQVSDTLHAAALDPDAREQVKDGGLERELRHVGLGGLEAASSGAPAGRQSRRGGDHAKRTAAARRAEVEARRRLEAAERRLRESEQRRERAAAALSDAEGAVTAAREVLAAAEEEHSRAERGLADD
jgi:hypothetical protein